MTVMHGNDDTGAPGRDGAAGTQGADGSARRLAAVEERLAQLEDEREITRLIASYGPLADSAEADSVAALWEPDGVYDVEGWLMTGRAEIAAMVGSERHGQWLSGGCAHVVGPPRVTVTGDEAVAVCHSLMVVHGESGFTVHRATANHWRLHRSSAGWLVTYRTNRVLDGRPESPRLLASGFESGA
ncbi:nuclear transport factor 2 family protein [Streptomyces sp. NBC_01500]|uniref:nuclear transport factor 2 family protein n=1 Tax=Streptomyces sp. NBC_01500 TaxID=2903886 RepID=UPI00225B54AC|nr:nuclear transport factor 2 family protein [Streptomyces sp. NBC_01500]MCX4552826.1 nuclear transport factor 2 family protein [Streptomyces sp. NBC_01500]